MATSEALMQTFFGTVPHCLSSTTYLSKLDSSVFPKFRRKCVRERGLRCAQAVKFTNMQKVNIGFGYLRERGCLYGTATRGGQCKSIVFCVEPAESVKGSADVDDNGSWYVDNAKKLHTVNTVMNGSNAMQDMQPLCSEVSAESKHDVSYNVSVDPIEEEAWELLRESVVNYCGSPVGTIAARDPTSSDALNYDQVFIRDFIPSGIAFLLKEEYDIVRNFILHTLQLQVCGSSLIFTYKV